jgi:sugar/nucleoside kinase (ribokinase family)
LRVEAGAPGEPLESDYVAVGHVTIDRFADGSYAAGGSALFSTLLAARCGWQAAIVTAGDPAALGDLLAPFEDDVRVLVAEPGSELTSLVTSGRGLARSQRVAASAPEVPFVPVEARVVHLAPVLRETGAWTGRRLAPLVGLTPQGLLRRWDGPGAEIGLFEPDGLDAYDADVVVLSEAEARCARGLIDAAALVVVTREEQPALVRFEGAAREIAGFSVEAKGDLGAGDVFAAALLVARAEGLDLDAAVRFAHAAGAAQVAVRGGAHAVPDRAAVEAILRS